MINFLITSLALWRIAVLFIKDRGPYAVLEKFREEIGIVNFADLEPKEQSDILGELQLMPHEMPPQTWSFNELGKMFECIFCLSFWLALIYVLLFEKEDKLKKVFAYSGMVILIESVS